MTPQSSDSSPSQVPTTAAVCGLCCDACSIFIGSHEDPRRLALLAVRLGWEEKDAHCDGCRSQIRTPYCRSCTLFACAERHGYSFCGECEDYPCADLQAFQRERPHRAELWANLERIGEIGPEAWLVEAKERNTCPSCGTLNSAYDLQCRKCGHEPASAFVTANREAIVEARSNS